MDGWVVYQDGQVIRSSALRSDREADGPAYRPPESLSDRLDAVPQFNGLTWRLPTDRRRKPRHKGNA